MIHGRLGPVWTGLLLISVSVSGAAQHDARASISIADCGLAADCQLQIAKL